MRNFFRFPALAAALWLIGGSGGLAEGLRASPWRDLGKAQIRLLLDETVTKDGKRRGGVEIRLAEGYKTYWRSPGDSGVPPHFDFSSSDPAMEIEVEYPVPETFDDGAGGQAWGYQHAVIFPLRFDAPKTPLVRLALKLDFAVCGTMCIPIAGEIALVTTDKTSVDQAEIALFRHFQARVPVLVPAGGNALPALTGIRRLASSETPAWDIDLALPDRPRPPLLFPEGKGYLTIASVQPLAPGHVRVRLNGQRVPGSDGGFNPARLTIVMPEQGFELPLDLDTAPSAP